MSTIILDVLGNGYRGILLFDDNSLSTGGISKAEETLGEFMEDANISPLDHVGKLQRELQLCGIKQIEEIDSYLQRIIDRKIQDIEDELGVSIDYTWDYIEFE